MDWSFKAMASVKVHRRNIYRKLRIKSQAGLFARFVEIIDARIG